MAGKSEKDQPIEIGEESVNILHLLEEYLRILKAAGEKIGKTYAMPQADEKLGGIIDELNESFLTDGLPSPIDYQELEAPIPPKEEIRPATDEELKAVFESMNALILDRDTYFGIQGVFAGKKRIKGKVYLPNLPDIGYYISSEADVFVEGKLDSPTSMEVDLSNFTNPITVFHRTVLKTDTPLGYAASVRVSVLDQAKIQCDVAYRVLPSTEEKIFSRMRNSTSKLIYSPINNLQTEQLLQIFQPRQLK